jgi:hypothetical protein
MLTLSLLPIIVVEAKETGSYAYAESNVSEEELKSFKKLYLTINEKNVLRSGDIVFRTGFGYWAYFSKKFNGNWSHVGIVKRYVDGKITVIHSHGKDGSHDFSGVQEESLEKFVEESSEIKIYRIAENDADAEKISTSVSNLIGKEFDTEFSLTNDKYYCSELAYKANPVLFSKFTTIIRPSEIIKTDSSRFPEKLEVINLKGILKAIESVNGLVVVYKNMSQIKRN